MREHECRSESPLPACGERTHGRFAANRAPEPQRASRPMLSERGPFGRAWAGVGLGEARPTWFADRFMGRGMVVVGQEASEGFLMGVVVFPVVDSHPLSCLA